MPTEYKAVSASTVEELTTLVNAQIADGFSPNYPIGVCACAMDAEMMCHYAQGLIKVTE